MFQKFSVVIGFVFGACAPVLRDLRAHYESLSLLLVDEIVDVDVLQL